MLDRAVRRVVEERLRDAPAVVLVGPRQCGKTTLARSLGTIYFDLEQVSERLRLDLEWPQVISSRELVVLDEAQAWPEVFVRLRGAIDADRRRMGRFLLLGSVAPSLMTQVSESLAGRLSIIELSPFVWGELSPEARERLWLCGGFPDGGVLEARRFPQWHRDYLELLVQRDLPGWGFPGRPSVTQRFVRMLAADHGQTWNASRIGRSLGINYQTVNSYLDHLEGAFLVRRLLPFHGNVRKRLVKAPKVFWRDSGLLHSIMGVSDRDDLLARPWVGASWEGFVVGQIMDSLGAAGIRHEAFHLRTGDGHEIDLVLELGAERWAVEVKLTTNPGPSDIARLGKVADLIAADQRALVSQTPRVVEGADTVSCNLPWLLERLGAPTGA